MKSTGYFLLAVGLIAMVASFFFPVSVNLDAVGVLDPGYAVTQSPIANLDKIAIRAMLHASAAVLAIIGAVFAAVGELRGSDAPEKVAPAEM